MRTSIRQNKIGNMLRKYVKEGPWTPSRIKQLPEGRAAADRICVECFEPTEGQGRLLECCIGDGYVCAACFERERGSYI